MAAAGSFTYDLASDIGRVRLCIADTDPDQHDFTDDEIEAALDRSGGSVERAGAWLLLALAANRSRLAVSVRRGELSEDLSKVAAELRAQAQALLAQADAADEVPLAATVSPTYNAYTAARNALAGRQGTVTEVP